MIIFVCSLNKPILCSLTYSSGENFLTLIKENASILRKTRETNLEEKIPAAVENIFSQSALECEENEGEQNQFQNSSKNNKGLRPRGSVVGLLQTSDFFLSVPFEEELHTLLRKYPNAYPASRTALIKLLELRNTLPPLELRKQVLDFLGKNNLFARVFIREIRVLLGAFIKRIGFDVLLEELPFADIAELGFFEEGF